MSWKAVFVSVLAFVLCLTVSAYPDDWLYRYPESTVMIKSTILPEVLMPGDTGIVSIDIQNCADQYVISYQDEDFSLTMPIFNADLCGTDHIEVNSREYETIGSIGPGDTITVFYNIKMDQNITDGTHFLDFKLVGGYEEDPRKINRRIPVKVDSSAVTLIKSEPPTSSSISLDVANPRQNTLNAVSIVPKAYGVEFSPEEYYIGTMEPDEIFTIDFDMKATKMADEFQFNSVFKNGETWHESDAYVVSVSTIPEAAYSDYDDYDDDRPGGNKPSIMGGMIGYAALILLDSICGLYLWQRRKSKGKQS